MKQHYKVFTKLSAKMGLLLLLGLMSFQAQAQKVVGTITDGDLGDPLIGVSILVKSSGTGTVTDIDGKYEVQAATGDILIFSYTGFQTQEIAVAGNTLDVKMSAASELLDEVVVIGYGAVKKEDLTGVVTKVSEEEFNKGVITSPEKLLTGKVAGVQISSNGEPGGATNIRIRGGTSISASNEPLYVVDGVPLDNRGIASSRNPLNFINPADIQDITVLKDASATAIYGSRGANGVVVITTKSGVKGKTRINYSGNYSISQLANQPRALTPENFRLGIEAKAPQELANLGTANTNWVDEIIDLASGHQHNLSASGGLGDKSNYFASVSYRATDGVLKTSRNDNTSASLSLSTKALNDNLNINIKTKNGWTNDQFAPNVIGAALAFDPTRPVYDDNSAFGGFYQWDDPLATNNPLSTLLLTDEKGKTFRTLNSLNLKYDLPFLEGLSFNANGSYDRTVGEKSRLEDPLLKDNENFVRGGSLFQEDLRNYSVLLETYGTYKKELPNIKSKFEYTLGYSWQDFDRENYWTAGNQLVQADNEFGFIPTEEIKPDSFLLHNRLISFFTRLNYNYDEKYLVTLSLRRDGSTRFGLANRWGLFPSAAIGWRILQEDFAKGLKGVFSDLKLRASYGITGNEDIDDYLFTTFYSFGTGDAAYQFGDEYVTTLRGVGVDPNIKWESTATLNTGLDFGFFEGRLTGSLEYYKKTTNDLLFTVAAAAFTNLSDRILTNISQLENQGVELSLNSFIIDRKNFDWQAGFNIAYNRNEITKLDNSNLPEFLGYETGGISGDVGQQIQILKVGESINSFRAYQHILDANGNPLSDTKDHNGDGFINPLDIYVDQDGDGTINERDLAVGQNGAPKFILGFTSNVNYKNFDLSLTLRSNLGNYVYNNVASSTGFFERLTDRVTNNVDESAFITDFKQRQLKSDYYIENASFLKVDNITLGYNFPIKDDKVFNNLRLFTTAQNVLTITNYSGLDPELPQFNQGIDNNTYPVFRTFLLGLNAGF